MDVCKALATPPAPPPSPAPVAYQPARPSSPAPPTQNIYAPRDVSQFQMKSLDPETLHAVPEWFAEAEPVACNSAPFPDCLIRPRTPGTDIGRYKDCHLIAEGLASKVYRRMIRPKPYGNYAFKVCDTHPPAPHNPQREYKIVRSLMTAKPYRHHVIHIVSEIFYNEHGHFVMVSPYVPFTLDAVLSKGPMNKFSLLYFFENLFSGLAHIHKLGIIHRDIKPSNILITSPRPSCENDGGYPRIIDFGTAWHPVISLESSGDNIPEPADSKIIEVGTSCYRAPETLFGNKAYDTSLDMWSAGCVLAECLSTTRKTLFSSPPSYEDGNQLGLILSIFKTLGTPTPATWPEALNFPTKPFEWYREFPAKIWDEILPLRADHAWGGMMNSDHAVPWSDYQDLVRRMVTYESGKRMTAEQAEKRFREYTDREGKAQMDDHAYTDEYDMYISESEGPYSITANGDPYGLL